MGAAKTYSSQDVAAGALGSETIDGLLDTVAGSWFSSYVTALRPGGILSLVGGGEVAFDAYRLLEVTLTGYSSETLDGAALRQAIGSISELLKQGAITAPSRTVLPLREATAAHTRLEQHLVQGRVLLIPDSGT